MTQLETHVKEEIGKQSYVMRGFFQDLITKGELQAWDIEYNKTSIEEREDETITRVKKGATLRPITKLGEQLMAIIEYPTIGAKYYLEMGSEGGIISTGGGQTTYHHCVIEKLSSFDPKKVTARRGYGLGSLSYVEGMEVPEETVTARLKVRHEEVYDDDELGRSRGSLVVEGEQDTLFKMICEFVRKK